MPTPSPFPHHGPLKPDQVRGRGDIVIDLAQRVADRRVTALLGPRRYGKTSVLNKVAADIGATDHDVVWVDLYALTSMTDLHAALATGLRQATGPLRTALDTVASGLSINLGIATYELKTTKGRDFDARRQVIELLGVLTTAAERSPTLIVIDEFAGIDRVDGGAGVLRTALQHHTQTLGLLFAGSQPSTMRMLFTDQAQPFFGQADLIELGPLHAADVVELVQRGFTTTGRDPGAGPGRVAELCEGHPQRTMQLADALWRLTPKGEAVTDEVWERALADVRSSVDLSSERVFSLLKTGQQKVLRVLSAGGSIYGSAAKMIELPPATAKNAAATLVDLGFIERTDDQWKIVDPLLSDWLRRRFS